MTQTVSSAMVDWIAVDWQADRIAAVALGAKGIVGRRETREVASAGPQSHEAALLALIGDWLRPGGTTPVLACGALGARDGWIETPFRKVPVALDPAADLVAAPASDPRIQVWVVPGLSQERPAEVMRGEETRIAGFLAGNPDFDGVLCLAGITTKWVHVSAREVVSFRTAMTGELFACLSSHAALLRDPERAGRDDGAFAEAVGQTLSRPERLASELFSIRAEGLLRGIAPATARARLSGLLIGAELAAMRPYWLGQQVAVIGTGDILDAYVRGLAEVGIVAETADGASMALAGLAAIRAGMRTGTA
ncbi:2-dehydro-3-deoxygalactonokinase [Defluviimonas sp. WL0002]|uniref:2-dehydro-3-deoxygalactonokinase n=1 Tax=Albidovulum marisflavi TaxID=2984159 RepID=A0ABT2Z8M4_9RHOB|nr:2-dehydro-3-deoxygalactonokinase [Defluviimonas sp. WL0002]MCV2867499.1 2-dehydro-3-deoxygalactonokinase [Defluviimonas sp. WL0002]